MTVPAGLIVLVDGVSKNAKCTRKTVAVGTHCAGYYFYVSSMYKNSRSAGVAVAATAGECQWHCQPPLVLPVKKTLMALLSHYCHQCHSATGRVAVEPRHKSQIGDFRGLGNLDPGALYSVCVFLSFHCVRVLSFPIADCATRLLYLPL